MKTFKSIIQKLKSINYIMVLAWVLPIGILLTILYYNFLPFGYNKSFTIDVGTVGDDKGQFYLDTSRADLGSRQKLDGKTFRYLDGLAYAVYKPKVVLNNATIEATLEADEGVSFILPPDLSEVKWDYDWNASNISESFEIRTIESDLYKRFSSAKYEEIAEEIAIENLNKELAIEVEWLAGEQSEILSGDITASHNQKTLTLKYRDTQIDYKLPDFFLGKNHNILIAFEGKNLHLFVDGITIDKKSLKQEINKESNLKISKAKDTSLIKLRKEIKPEISIKDDCIYLDGKSRLVMPNTADEFEEGPFTIYLEWIPEKKEDRQQLIGHYNWEIYQSENTVRFTVGRMNDNSGSFYSIEEKLNDNYLNKNNSLIAIYSPVSQDNPIGYIELYINNVFAGKNYFANDVIYKDYGGNDLSIGWSNHSSGKLPYFQGSVCQANFIYQALKPENKKSYKFTSSLQEIKLPISGVAPLNSLKLKVNNR